MNTATNTVMQRPLTIKYVPAAVAFGAVVLLIAWVMVAALLQWQWKETLQSEIRQNTNTAVALKEHTLRILDAVDQALQLIQKRVVDGEFTGDTLIRIANETGMAPGILTQLSVTDARGIFLGSNLDLGGSRSKNVDLSDRVHIRVHLRPETTPERPMQNGLYISKPLLGKVSGVRTIQLTRKIVAPDGTTLGVVVASLNQQHFIDVYRSVDFGTQGGVVLAGLDGVIRARVIGNASAEIEKPLPEALVAATRSHSVGSTVAVGHDGVERIIGFSRVGDYDLVVQCGTSVVQAFAAWDSMRVAVMVLTGVLSVGLTVFFAGMLVSVRRLKRSNQALQRSEAEAQRANQAKSEFLAAMSHELRTPLSSIRGFAELLELRSKEDTTREQAGLIRQGAEHLNTLLTEILDLAKIEAGAMQLHWAVVELRPFLGDTVQLFNVSAVAKNLKLELVCADNVPQQLYTDGLKLKQILNNLLSNAIKFTETGSVTLAAEPTEDGQRLRLHVRDTGCGIAPHLHEKVFEKFSQGNAKVSYTHGGTGLGLSLSRELAQLLKGRLSLQSAEGAGTVVTLEIPLG